MRILHFIYGLHVGGAETFLINLIEHLDAEKYKIDFALQDADVSNKRIKKYISEHNSKIHVIPRFPVSLVAQYFELRRIIRREKYDFVHIHMNAAVNPIPLLFARRGNSETKFIIHSHSTSNSGGRIGKFLHRINSKLLINANSIHIACSESAGSWMFGKSGFMQIDNAINTAEYKFSSSERDKIRAEFGISQQTKVIGHVGRFVQAKNHEFIIDWFSHYVKCHPDSVLMLVGNGELYETIRNAASERALLDRVIFTGLRTDTPSLLSAMDCFIFPSHFEGLGFVAVEAQSTGLYVVASENIPDVVNVKNHINFVSLSASYEKWTDEIDSAIAKTGSADRLINPVVDSRFDLNKMIADVILLYK